MCVYEKQKSIKVLIEFVGRKQELRANMFYAYFCCWCCVLCIMC